MRIAAGVILIIAALINLFAAIGYLTLGAGAGMAGKLTQMAEAEQKKSGQEMTAEQKAQMAKADEMLGQVSNSAGKFMGFSVFLFVTVGTSIAGAVCLFRSKAGKFIMVASILAIAAEVIGSVLIGFGPGKILGLLGGILGILGARGIMAKDAAPAAMPPPAAAPM